MNQKPNRTSVRLISLVSFSIVALTLLISLIARGYRFNFPGIRNGQIITVTGILSATSEPEGASVYLNDRLVTATDNTLNLNPDNYQIKIVKDGYLPWQKTIQIKKETVYQTDAQLFRSVPDLSPITFTGAINPTISPDGSKIIYSVASASAASDNGLFLIELNNNFPLNLNRNTPRQLADNLNYLNWADFDFTFSPDSSQVLAINSQDNISYLLSSLNTNINARNLYDVTPTLKSINQEWQEQLEQLTKVKLEKLPEQIQPFVSTDSAKDIQFSTSEKKFIYLAKEDGNLIDKIITPPPAQSTQPQRRDIKQGNYYVYDLKDDTNFLIGSQQDLTNPNWLANSESIIFTHQQNIKVIDYDSTNQNTLFAGKFDENKVFTTPDGKKIITLISPYQGAQENIYTISIR